MIVHPRKIGVSILLVIGIVYTLLVLRGPHGVAALIEKHRQIHELEMQNAALSRRIEEQRARIERLKNNPVEQELEIRQRLKLVKPGEKVFILQDRARR